MLIIPSIYFVLTRIIHEFPWDKKGMIQEFIKFDKLLIVNAGTNKGTDHTECSLKSTQRYRVINSFTTPSLFMNYVG